MGILILWPTFALAALAFAMFLIMFVKRLGHIRANPPAADDLASGEAAMRYFAPVEMPANNYRNLFEMPVLFFALVPLLLVTSQDSSVQVVLAWVYVALRYLHSFVHVGPKKVQVRAMLFVVSAIVLSAMWIGFAIDIASADMVLEQAVEDTVAV